MNDQLNERAELNAQLKYTGEDLLVVHDTNDLGWVRKYLQFQYKLREKESELINGIL